MYQFLFYHNQGYKIYLCTLQKIVRLGMYIQVIKQSIIITTKCTPCHQLHQHFWHYRQAFTVSSNACLVLREANV